MSYIDPESHQHIYSALKAHRRRVLRDEQHQASLVKDNAAVPEAPYPICIADIDTPCDCPSCQQYEAESMADAMATYRPVILQGMVYNECECGGTYDEDERCSDCTNGHDDCDIQGCFACLERAIDRAEQLAEGMER